MKKLCYNKYGNTHCFLFSLRAIFSALIMFFCAESVLSANLNPYNICSKRTIEFSYNISVKNIPVNSKHLEIWLPVPKSDNHQEVSNLNISCDYPYTFKNESKYNNLILAIESDEEVSGDLSVSMDFQVTRKGYRVTDKLELSKDGANHLDLERYLLPGRLVPVEGIVAEEAQGILNKNMASIKKARVLYDHVVSTMSYDKSGEGWGKGDAVYACNVKKGNCTDFHSLFISMARASGIPSRFVIGFPIPDRKKQGEIYGYHCWAEFYVDGLGWVPIDASEASKYAEKRDLFFGGLDANRVQFTIGRDIQIEDNLNIMPLNYFIYPYVRIDEKPYLDVKYHFRFKDLN